MTMDNLENFNDTFSKCLGKMYTRYTMYFFHKEL